MNLTVNASNQLKDGHEIRLNAVVDLKKELARIQAIKIEYGNRKGTPALLAYYQDGVVIVTLDIPTLDQLVYENNVLVGSSDAWTIETLNGETYVKHSYPSGSAVYTSQNSQFVVIVLNV